MCREGCPCLVVAGCTLASSRPIRGEEEALQSCLAALLFSEVAGSLGFVRTASLCHGRGSQHEVGGQQAAQVALFVLFFRTVRVAAELLSEHFSHGHLVVWKSLE